MCIFSATPAVPFYLFFLFLYMRRVVFIQTRLSMGGGGGILLDMHVNTSYCKVGLKYLFCPLKMSEKRLSSKANTLVNWTSEQFCMYITKINLFYLFQWILILLERYFQLTFL